LKAGGNIAPANSQESRRLQSGASNDRVIGWGRGEQCPYFFVRAELGIEQARISEKAQPNEAK